MNRYVLLLLIGLTIGLQGQEQVTLTTPETRPSTSFYRVERLTLSFDDPATTLDEGTIVIQLRGENGEAASCVYDSASSPTGTVLLNGLNKANLSTAYANNTTTGSLKQRIFHRLVIMNEAVARCGKTLTGTVAGAVP